MDFTSFQSLSFKVQNDVQRFNTERLFSHSDAKIWVQEAYLICDSTTSLARNVVQYTIYTSVMWKLEASSAQTLRMDFTVK